jgi:hypothetical protein
MAAMGRALLVCGLVAAAVMAPPAAPPVGACDPGPFLDMAPMGDLGVTAQSPGQPALISAVRVKPRSRIGCQCSEPCIEDVLVEFRLATEAPWARFDAGGFTRYTARAAGSDPGESIFYYHPGSFPGPVPEVFDVSVLDDAGHRSPPVSTSVARDSEPELR